jgi:hypothetical protein
MKTTDHFKKVLQDHLEARAAGDEVFASTYAKTSKNLDDCAIYILNQVQSSGRMGFADEEVYGMAVHYYEEDEIEIGGNVSAHVVVNKEIQLSPDELEKAKATALANVIRREEEKLSKSRSKKNQQTAPTGGQLNLEWA